MSLLMFSRGPGVVGYGGRARPVGGRKHFFAVFAQWQPNDWSDLQSTDMVGCPCSRPFHKCLFARCEVKNKDFMREKPLCHLFNGRRHVPRANHLKS